MSTIVKSTPAAIEAIRQMHIKERGWRDIGYHWLIDRDGTVLPGRKETEIGAHVVGHNAGTIGICLIGGAGGMETDSFADHFTPDQETALGSLCRDIMRRTAIIRITGHNQYARKACPCFYAPAKAREMGLT